MMCFAEPGHPTGTAGGIPVSADFPQYEKVWGVFNALGALAFAYSFSNIMVEVQVCVQLTVHAS